MKATYNLGWCALCDSDITKGQQIAPRDDWEFEGRISAGGMRHDYFHPDGTVTRYDVRYATRRETVDLYRRTLVDPDRGMVGSYPSNGGHLATFRTGRAFPDHMRTVDVAMIREHLAGHDLACWCPLDSPCHADVLLEIANGADA